MTLQLTQILAMIFVALLTVALPLGLMLALRRRSGKWGPFWVGVLIFVVSAMVLEQVFHTLVFMSPLGPVLQGSLLATALYGGLAAGLFEETGRLAAFRLLLRGERAPVTALAYGAGHGGVEAVLLVGLTMVNNLALAALVGGGAVTDPAVLAAAETLAATPAGMFLWAGLERCSAVALHLANSVLVFAAVRGRRYGLYLLAILTHAVANFLAVMLSTAVPTAVVELAVLAWSLLTAAMAWRVYRGLPAAEQ